MTTARILVIEHQRNAGLGLLEQPLIRGGAALEIVGPDTGLPLPDGLTGFDGLIVLGGSMGPEDDADAPWLPDTRRLLAEGVAHGVPTLGVCLGAQMLAVANGGSARTMPGGPEIGVQTVAFASGAEVRDAAADPLFGALAGDAVAAVQWHYLEIDELPAGSRALASNAHCRNQAYRIGETAWGVQFHPEATTPTAEEWVLEDADELDRLGRDPGTIVSEVRESEPELRRIWESLAERFAGIATASAAERAAEASADAFARQDHPAS